MHFVIMHTNCAGQLSSQGCLLDDLVSLFGTKIVVGEPIVHELCVGRNREMSNLVVRNFAGVFKSLPVYYLREVFKTRLESFWS